MNRVNRSHTISSGAPSKSKEQFGISSLAEEQELKKTNNIENLNGKYIYF